MLETDGKSAGSGTDGLLRARKRVGIFEKEPLRACGDAEEELDVVYVVEVVDMAGEGSR